MSLLDTASLIVTPNGYKEGKLYSVIPSDGSGDMSVVRATTATRVNSAGLVELVPYNLVNYSEQFDNAAWVKTNATISANAIASPSGVQDADLLQSSNSTEPRIRQTTTQTGSATFSYSCFAKKGNVNFLILRNIAVNIGGGSRAWFNLDTGVIGTVNSGLTASIESVGNGWYRCNISGTTDASPTNLVDISLSATDNSISGSAIGSNIYIWGAQLNEGTIKDYQKTETRLNIPRLDYSNGTCPSLLVEPQRTNTILNSVLSGTTSLPTSWNFSTSTGTSAPTPSIYSQIGQAYSFTTASTRQAIFQNQSYTSGSTYSFSVFVESVTGSIRVDNVIFQTVAGTQTFYKDGVLINASDFIESGHRYTTLMVASSTTTAQVRIGNGTGGPTTATVVLSMPQLELGSYPTSYIPTTSASVTRNADVISKTGISSLIGQTEGTMFLDLSSLSNSVINEQISISDGTDANTIKFVIGSAVGGVSAQGRISSITQFSITKATTDFVSNKKIAVAYKANDFVFYYNGEQVGIDLSGLIPSMSVFAFSTGASTFAANVNVKAAALWKTRLTNDELATLTTI
jgi:hypothetical protein